MNNDHDPIGRQEFETLFAHLKSLRSDRPSIAPEPEPSEQQISCTHGQRRREAKFDTSGSGGQPNLRFLWNPLMK